MHRLLLLGGGGSSAGVGGGGSFTTLNPSGANPGIVLTNGNLSASRTGADTFKGVKSVAVFSSGKYHIEVTADELGNSAGLICGIMRSDQGGSVGYPGESTLSLGFQVNNFYYVNGAQHDADNPGVFAVGDVLVCEFDHDNGTFKVAINNGSYVSANYPAGIVAGVTEVYFMVGMFTTTNDCTVNFGASAFVKTPTATFVGLS